MAANLDLNRAGEKNLQINNPNLIIEKQLCGNMAMKQDRVSEFKIVTRGYSKI